ncbi:coiled-coil and C2 domain-containing protein 1-like [Mizuhopecten yessoensis]|uniref:coiled-coil and C2 domain-containing protein 1-like n=1 Tax=Mizuhopecten yessoensis TaxID=6573 RepID=UPI000B45C619|nr:coiled-coil and C2 domain-containing protein 1-like [Mizuhopecten yessoensis]
MFGRKKEAVDPPKRKGADLMNQLGFAGNMGGHGMDDDDDAALEAELLALQGEGPPKPRTKDKKGKDLVSLQDIGKMADDCMKDINSEEEMSDTEDPDLLAELQDLEAEDDDDDEQETPSSQSASVPQQSVDMLSVVQERLSLYQQAQQAAKEAGDSSKQRRLERGIKTLQDLNKKVKAGRAISEDDIPPPVTVSSNAPRPPPAASQAPVFEPTLPQREPSPKPAPVQERAPVVPETQTTAQSSPEQTILVTRQQQYKQAALHAKNSGDMTNAAKYIKIAKVCT